VVLNLPLIGIWIRLLKVPYRILFPPILVFCSIGVYSPNYNTFDIMATTAFGFRPLRLSQIEMRRSTAAVGLDA
jgi:putative tricarboxylic transport membrane protein